MTPARRPSHPPTARRAVASLFFLNGVLIATWVSRIPALRNTLGLSHAALGLALLAMALGALLAMPTAGWLSARVGSARVCQVSTLCYAAALPLLALAPSVPLLTVALFFFGAVHGALDVGMNAQAVAVEQLYPSPIMSSLHALFSLGGLVGAGFGALVASRQVAPLLHFQMVALLLGGSIALFSFPSLLPKAPLTEPHQPASAAKPRFTLPAPGLLLLGLIAFCTMVGEGAMADWTGLFLREVAHSSEGFAALGYAAFSIAMAGGRFAGDALSACLGPVFLVRVGGLLAAVGLALALLVAQPLVALLGFAAVGLGFATVVPQVFSAAGATSGQAGTAVATVSTLGYLGFLIGPPLIGFLAELTGLRMALWLIVGTSALLPCLAPRVRRVHGTE